MVCVSPGMLATKVMVAPNSPSARAKARIAPTSRPGTASGSETSTKRQAGLAPSVPAAASRRGSIVSKESRIARTISGNPITAQASAAPVQRNDSTMPTSASAWPKMPRRPKATSSR